VAKSDYYTEIGTGIATLFDNDTNLSGAMTGGLWFREVPETASFPYLVHFPVAGKPMYWFGETVPEEGEEILWQFNGFYQGESAININIYESYLRDLYDWANVSLTNYTLMEMRRESSLIFKVDDVWQFSVTYRIKVTTD